MTALLVYKNESPEVMAWAADYKARSRTVGERRTAFIDAFYAEHGVTPADGGGTFSRGAECVGVAWPDDAAIPKGWRRPADDPRLIKPHLSTRIGKDAAAELAAMTWPDARSELSKHHGMRSYALVPGTNHYYTPGLDIQDDGVWISWGSRDVAPELVDAEAHGWVRVPLTEYIERFGEDAL